MMNIKSNKPTVGVVGLGIIGSRAVANLRKSGHRVLTWSRTPKLQPNFLTSAAEVASGATVVEIFVSDGAALLEVVRAMEPVLGSRHVVMNHATVSPKDTMEACRIVEARGARFLDAPFTGSLEAADACALVFMVGGEEKVLDGVRGILEVNGRCVLHVGPVGAGTVLKVATNLIAATTVAAAAEGMALMSKAGVSLSKLPEVLAFHGVRSDLLASKVRRMILDDFEPHFALKHMLKDVGIAMDLAHEHGLKLAVAGGFAQWAAEGIQAGWGDLDYAVVAKLFGYPDRGVVLDERVCEVLAKGEGGGGKGLGKGLLDFFKR